MKTSFWAFTLAGFLAVCPTWVSAEQGPQKHHWDPAQMQKGLGLTDDQMAKLKAAKDAQKTAMKPLRDQMKSLMEKLGDQVKAKAPDADIQSTLDSLKQTRNALREQMEKGQEQMASLLTPTQRAKMLLRMAQRGPHGKGGHGMKRSQGSQAPDDHEAMQEPPQDGPPQ